MEKQSTASYQTFALTSFCSSRTYLTNKQDVVMSESCSVLGLSFSVDVKLGHLILKITDPNKERETGVKGTGKSRMATAHLKAFSDCFHINGRPHLKMSKYPFMKFVKQLKVQE